MKPQTDSGLVLVIVIMLLAILAALALSLVVVMTTETQIASNYAASREVMYAADGAIEIAAQELLAFSDWNVLLGGGATSSFVDGPPTTTRRLSDGRSLILGAATDTANTQPRPWGANNPVWRAFAYGWLGPITYVVAWVGDDPAENDGDPAHDGNDPANPGSGIIAIRAEAFGTGGARKIVEATLRRTVDEAGNPTMQMLSWAELR